MRLECGLLVQPAMTVELVSKWSGRRCQMHPKSFGKLLHLARLNGWSPEKLATDWPSDSWKTEVILPYIGPYMPGTVSNLDADGLRKALIRAMAVGDIASDGSVQYAGQAFLDVARAGSFEVRFLNCQSARSIHPAFVGAGQFA